MISQLTMGETYTASQMNDFIGGKHQGGIRYSESFPDIRRLGVIIGGGVDAIYPDELHGGSITYIGEGQVGDQKLAMGNRALVWAHFNDFPVHVFINLAKNCYQYRGAHRVAMVSATIALDRSDGQRGAFSFTLQA
jgi:hypothetical protein